LTPALSLKPLFENDPDLLNTYAVIVPEITGESGAMQLATWLSDGDGRNRIASFAIAETHPFIIWPAGAQRDRPDALPR